MYSLLSHALEPFSRINHGCFPRFGVFVLPIKLQSSKYSVSGKVQATARYALLARAVPSLAAGGENIHLGICIPRYNHDADLPSIARA